jgi:hypothetical protein
VSMDREASYLQVTFDLEFHSFARFEQSMAQIVPSLTTSGWILRGALRNITGNICLATHLWQLPADDPGHSAEARLKDGPPELADAYASLREFTKTELVQFVAPLSYHPSATAAAGGAHADSSVYQRVLFDLEPGHLVQFERSMSQIVPALSEQGWHLVAALRKAAGSVDMAFNLWRLPDLESLVSAGRGARAAHPELGDAVAPLVKILRSESIDVMAPLAHHPKPNHG